MLIAIIFIDTIASSNSAAPPSPRAHHPLAQSPESLGSDVLNARQASTVAVAERYTGLSLVKVGFREPFVRAGSIVGEAGRVVDKWRAMILRSDYRVDRVPVSTTATG
jgi:hypothetical protein